MKIQKQIARKLIFPIAMTLGYDKVLRNRASDSILNVMYHGVVTSNSNYFSPRHIDEKQFEKHLNYYKKNFEVISISEAFEKTFSNEKIDKKYLTISFDDGFKNNLITALPILEKYNFPTTFFISSICTENSNIHYLWPEMISAIKYFLKDTPIIVNGHTFVNLVCHERNYFLPDYLKTISCKERDMALKLIEEEHDLRTKIISLPEEIWKLLNNNELIKLSESKIVTIGSHAHNHYNLGEIGFVCAKQELMRSKELLEKSIGQEVTSIAYPDGSYNSEVKDLAKEIGYKYQFAVKYKLAEDLNDPRIMPRHGISSTTTFESNMFFLNRAFKTISVK